eukprot:gene17469-12492_t
MLTIIQSQFATNDGSSTLQLPKKLVLRLHSNDSMGYEQLSAQAALATSSSSSSSSKSSSRSSRSSQSAQKRRRLNPRNELESAGAYDNSMIEESEMVDDPS